MTDPALTIPVQPVQADLDSFFLRSKLWLEDKNGLGLGPGRTRILQLIEELGSISKAASHLGMSYRRTWGNIKRLEASLGFPLLESETRRGGCHLTTQAKQLLEAYNKWVQSMDDCIRQSSTEFYQTLSKIEKVQKTNAC